MDDAWTRFIIFLLADPHLLEGGERGQDGSSDPDGVLPLRGSDDLDLHCGRGKMTDLLKQEITVSHSTHCDRLVNTIVDKPFDTEVSTPPIAQRSKMQFHSVSQRTSHTS